MDVYIVGIGPGNPELLTCEARRVIRSCPVLIGEKRMVASFACEGKKTYQTHSPAAIRQFLADLQEDQGPAAILVSGDTGFFSLAQGLSDLPGCTVTRCAGLSSLTYFAARLGMAWQDAYCLSRHGRKASLVSAVYSHSKVFCLTGGSDTVDVLCQELCQAGLDKVRVYAGSNLSYGDEEIRIGTAADLAGQSFDSLSVMMIENEDARPMVTPVHGIPDEAFLRGDAPMTKREIRSLAISLLQPSPADVVYDVGAGTGSCSIELALQVPFGQVWSFEADTKALALLEQNRLRFGLHHMTIVPGKAPQTMADTPPADIAFIGGTKGHMAAILDRLYAKNQACRIVITAITVETLAAVTAYYASRPQYGLDIRQIQAAVSRRVGSSHMMMARNPVYVLYAFPQPEGAPQ